MYAMRECEKSNRRYFYEVYVNARVYQMYREASYFKIYLAETEGLVLDKQFLDLANDKIVTKGIFLLLSEVKEILILMMAFPNR
ncbi:hypothetical protein [Streptococcus oralis]|nr:hypothetical protein [Streptococcus oralis]